MQDYRKNNQKGLSLIEIMLAMSISLLVLQQAHKLLLTLADSYTLLEQDIERDEGKQVALVILQHFISLSGYQEFTSINNNNKVYVNDNNFEEGAFVFGINNVSSKAGVMKNSDILMLRFQTPSALQIRDCKNTLLEADKNYTLDFYIDRNADFRCKGAASSNQLRYSAVLAHGIKDFQVEYAYRTTNELRFCDADCITNKSMWRKVVALRFILENKRYKNFDSGSYLSFEKNQVSVHTVYLDNFSRL